MQMVSSYRESCVRRKDARHTRGDLPPKPRVGNKKDTKRWCKGVVGREHKLQCVRYQEYKNSAIGKDWRLLLCTECRKELDYWYPMRWSTHQQPPAPDWVNC